MSELATIARANAIQLEVKKDGLQQTQNGDWRLRLTVQATDMDERITRAAMGQRFVCVLVEIADDETPKEVMPIGRTKQTVDTPPAPVDEPGRARKRFDELSAPQQAGILCSDSAFQKFIRTKIPRHQPVYLRPGEDVANKEQVAAAEVRYLCRVDSRTDIIPGTSSYLVWQGIVRDYRAWMREPEVVPA